MRYHQTLRTEIESIAVAFFELSPEERESVVKYARGRLIATDAAAVLSEPVPVRVLGSVSHHDYWQDVQLRDTISRAWGRQDEPGVIEIRVNGAIPL